MYSLMGIGRKDKVARVQAMLQNYEFFGAPVGLIITVDRCVDKNGWGHVGCFVQNICLLAIERGLGTCLQEAWADQHEVVRDVLGIPKNEVVWCGIALGYPDTSSPVNSLLSSREAVDHFSVFSGFRGGRSAKREAQAKL